MSRARSRRRGPACGIIDYDMRLLDVRTRLRTTLVALTMLAACAGSRGASDTIPDDVEHPWHPTCRESCEGHCDAATAEACRDRCDHECAPVNDATQPSG